MISLPRFMFRTELPSRSFRSMGGVATLTVGAADSQRIDNLTSRVRDIFERLEQELSTYRTSSAISLLADKAGVESVPLSEDAFRLLETALRFDAWSDGASDVTVAPLLKLWGFGATQSPVFPAEEAIRETLKFVDYRKVILKDRSAYLPLEGMGLDLGGIAKGYAVDLAFRCCRSEGVEDFLIDLSGNIRVSGRPQWGKSWQIGVRNPFDRSSIIGRIALRNGMALATSGSYERYIEIAGQRFCHILNPRTGFPVTGTAGVTLLSADATTADGLSTSFFVEGLKGCGKLLQNAPPAQVLLVPDKYPLEIWLTEGFTDVFAPTPAFANRVKVL